MAHPDFVVVACKGQSSQCGGFSTWHAGATRFSCRCRPKRCLGIRENRLKGTTMLDDNALHGGVPFIVYNLYMSE